VPQQRHSGTWSAPCSITYTCLRPSQTWPVLIYRPRKDGGLSKPRPGVWPNGCYVTACGQQDSNLSLSLSLIPGREDGSPPRSSPGSSIGVVGRFDSGDLAMTPTTPGRVLGSVTPDVLPSRQHHCNVDKWRSLDV